MLITTDLGDVDLGTEILNSNNKLVFSDTAISFTGDLAFHPPRNNTQKPIYFHNCIFKNAFRCEIGTGFEVHFRHCTFEKQVFFTIRATSIPFISSCTFEESAGIDSTTTIKVESSHFKKGLKYKQVNENGMSLENNHITTNPLEIDCEGRIYVRGGNIDTFTLLTGNASRAGFVSIEGVDLKAINPLVFPKGRLMINSCTVGSFFWADDDRIEGSSIELVRGVLAALTISPPRSGKLVVDSVVIGKIEVKGDNVDSVVQIAQSKIGELLFENFRNKSAFLLLGNSLNEGGKLSITSSDLTGVQFLQFDFNKGGFYFRNSKISEIFIAETDFPMVSFRESAINWKQVQLAFGQISMAYGRQGDSARTIEYRAKEVDAHFNHLRQTGSGSRTDLVSLFLIKWSNSFGTNWATGILFTLGIGILFFAILQLSTGGWNCYDPFDNIIIRFIKFMNPIRLEKLEDLFTACDDLTPVDYLIDTLARIFVGYGYYQTIQAFRKFGKSV